jgi:hypothetical protein
MNSESYTRSGSFWQIDLAHIVMNLGFHAEIPGMHNFATNEAIPGFL